MLGLKLNHVSKRGQRWQGSGLWVWQMLKHGKVCLNSYFENAMSLAVNVDINAPHINGTGLLKKATRSLRLYCTLLLHTLFYVKPNEKYHTHIIDAGMIMATKKSKIPKTLKLRYIFLSDANNPTVALSKYLIQIPHIYILCGMHSHDWWYLWQSS